MRTLQAPESNHVTPMNSECNNASGDQWRNATIVAKSFARDEGQKEECGADTRQWLMRHLPSTRMDDLASGLSSPIATTRKPRMNTKHPVADTTKSPICDPSLRMRRIKLLIIA